jgi:hypothetical protein
MAADATAAAMMYGTADLEDDSFDRRFCWELDGSFLVSAIEPSRKWADTGGPVVTWRRERGAPLVQTTSLAQLNRRPAMGMGGGSDARSRAGPAGVGGGSLTARARRFVREEVSTATRFGQVFCAADERDEIEDEIHRSAEQPFPAHGSPQRDERQAAANPGCRTVESPRGFTSDVLTHLFLDTHVSPASNMCSVIAGGRDDTSWQRD